MERKINVQNLAWFWDLYQRGILDLNPDYQRRSVWPASYKDFYIDTVLNVYPCPAIFLYEEISEDGNLKYSVVDGKQRLTTLFEFIEGKFATSEELTKVNLREKYFSDLDSTVKKKFWGYQFGVEYLPSSEQEVIKNIFDRINRNVSKLSQQELRHAKYEGPFLEKCEELADKIFHKKYLISIPRISPKALRQMGDVEQIANLLLLVEEGPQYYSQDDLDTEFSKREEDWEAEDDVVAKFEDIIDFIKELINTDDSFRGSRVKNKIDFYSLVGALADLDLSTLDATTVKDKLLSFYTEVDNSTGDTSDDFSKYLKAVKSSSNVQSSKITRIDILKSVIA